MKNKKEQWHIKAEKMRMLIAPIKDDGDNVENLKNAIESSLNLFPDVPKKNYRMAIIDNATGKINYEKHVVSAADSDKGAASDSKTPSSIAGELPITPSAPAEEQVAETATPTLN